MSDDLEALIDAADQVLDDMGTSGTGCCRAAKAQLRVAIEPFVAARGIELEWPLSEAKEIMEAVKQ